MGFDTHTGLLAVSQHSRKRTSGFRFSARFKGLIAYGCLPDLLIAILVQAFPLTTNKRLTSATIHRPFYVHKGYVGLINIEHSPTMYGHAPGFNIDGAHYAWRGCQPFFQPSVSALIQLPDVCNRPQTPSRSFPVSIFTPTIDHLQADSVIVSE